LIIQSERPIATIYPCYAQQIPSNNSRPRNYPENQISKYVGIWRFSSSEKIFTIMLKKARLLRKNGLLAHYLAGSYHYIENGILISGSINNKDTLLKASPNFDKNSLTLLFSDAIKHKLGGGFILLMDSDNKKLKWKLIDSYNVVIRPRRVLPGFSVPTDLILTKVRD